MIKDIIASFWLYNDHCIYICFNIVYMMFLYKRMQWYQKTKQFTNKIYFYVICWKFYPLLFYKIVNLGTNNPIYYLWNNFFQQFLSTRYINLICSSNQLFVYFFQVEHTMTEKRVLQRTDHPFLLTLKYSFTTVDR